MRNIVLGSRAKFSAEQVALMLVSRKDVKPESRFFRARFLPHLDSCLRQLNGTNAVLAAAEHQRISQFRKEDEPLLQQLWSLLVDTPLPARQTEEWKRLGRAVPLTWLVAACAVGNTVCRACGCFAMQVSKAWTLCQICGVCALQTSVASGA